MSGYLRTLDGHEHHVGETSPSIECFRCGICCTLYQSPLTPAEAETIARELGVSTEDFLSGYTQLTNVGYLLRHLEKGCVFLSWEEDGTRAICSIHPFRPDACRSWMPGLSRAECLEGLTRLKARGRIMLAKELYPSPAELDSFSEHLHERLKADGFYKSS